MAIDISSLNDKDIFSKYYIDDLVYNSIGCIYPSPYELRSVLLSDDEFFASDKCPGFTAVVYRIDNLCELDEIMFRTPVLPTVGDDPISRPYIGNKYIIFTNTSMFFPGAYIKPDVLIYSGSERKSRPSDYPNPDAPIILYDAIIDENGNVKNNIEFSARYLRRTVVVIRGPVADYNSPLTIRIKDIKDIAPNDNIYIAITANNDTGSGQYSSTYVDVDFTLSAIINDTPCEYHEMVDDWIAISPAVGSGPSESGDVELKNVIEFHSIIKPEPRASDNDNVYLKPSKELLEIGKTYTFDPKKELYNLDKTNFILYDTIRGLVETTSDFNYIYLVESNDVFLYEDNKRYCSSYKVIKRVEITPSGLFEIKCPVDVMFILAGKFPNLITHFETYVARYIDTDDIDPDFLLEYFRLTGESDYLKKVYALVNSGIAVPTYIMPLISTQITSEETEMQRVALIKKILDENYVSPYFVKNESDVTVVFVWDKMDQLLKFFDGTSIHPGFMKEWFASDEATLLSYASKYKDTFAFNHPVLKYLVNYYSWLKEFPELKSEIYDRLLNKRPWFNETFVNVLRILTDIGPNEKLLARAFNNYTPPEHLYLLLKNNVISEPSVVRRAAMTPIPLAKHSYYFMTNLSGSQKYYDFATLSNVMLNYDKIEPLRYYYYECCDYNCGKVKYKSIVKNQHFAPLNDHEECVRSPCLPPHDCSIAYYYRSVKNPQDGFGSKDALRVTYRDFLITALTNKNIRDISYLTDKGFSVMGFAAQYLKLVPIDTPNIVRYIVGMGDGIPPGNIDDDKFLANIYVIGSYYINTTMENKLVKSVKTAHGAYNWIKTANNHINEMYNVIKSASDITDAMAYDVAKMFNKDLNTWIGKIRNPYYKYKLIYSSSQ